MCCLSLCCCVVAAGLWRSLASHRRMADAHEVFGMPSGDMLSSSRAQPVCLLPPRLTPGRQSVVRQRAKHGGVAIVGCACSRVVCATSGISAVLWRCVLCGCTRRCQRYNDIEHCAAVNVRWSSAATQVLLNPCIRKESPVLPRKVPAEAPNPLQSELWPTLQTSTQKSAGNAQKFRRGAMLALSESK